MKLNVLFLMIVLSLLLLGCARTVQETPEEELPPPAEEYTVLVPEPEQPAQETVEEAPVEEEKQLALGTTDMKEEELSIISDVECVFGEEGPEKFSFRLSNTEDKKWVFRGLSYEARETADNPIVVLNALQITNNQLIESCGKKEISPGGTLTCDFNIEAQSNILIKKTLRTGLTAMGNENRNSLTVRTRGHAAEVVFLC